MQAAPIEIEYKRWVNKRKGYTVIVVAVIHNKGQHGWLTNVFLRSETGERKKAPVPAVVFLRDYKPVGRKIRIKSSWERL